MTAASLVAAGLVAAHGHSPFDAGLGWWEWAIAGLAALGSVWVIWLSIRWTLHPGEEGVDHVKRSILSDEPTAFDRPGPRAS